MLPKGAKNLEESQIFLALSMFVEPQIATVKVFLGKSKLFHARIVCFKLLTS